MTKKKIAIIYVDDKIKFISSYSYIGDYHPKWGDKLDPEKTKICLTNDIDSAFEWEQEYQIDTAYRFFNECLLKNPDVKSVLRVNTNVFKRFLKIKTLKEKCQKTNQDWKCRQGITNT